MTLYLLTYLLTISPTVHKYLSLRSTAHRAAAGRKGVRATVVTASRCTHAELCAMLWLAATAVACTNAVYGN